ncbi:hypothetical protein ACNF40_07075 [Cuniculiplasma sp. SKW4]|uniref:hypothetical protein n=1 Tax=Cuniculiplasma sp. SKW4 TaxID=3400171 RepID=UPI003FCF07FB
MIDMTPLREIAKNDPDLRRIIEAEPLKISEQEFISKLGLLWNFAKKQEVQK